MGRSTAAYILHNRKLLLLLRDDIPTIKDPNTWDTPGGACEGDESFDDCLKREVEEELELKVTNFIYLGNRRTPNGNIEANYVIEITDVEVNSLVQHEGQAYKFFTPDELDTLAMTKHLHQVFAQDLPELKEIIKGKRSNILLTIINE